MKTKNIILFSSIDNLTNKVFNMILWSLNSVLFGIGSYFIITNYEDLNKSNGIHDCGNIFLMIGLNTINSLLIIIGFFKFIFISIFTFISSLTLLTYNIYNIETINTTCINYYTNNYNNLWVFNKICIILLIINVLIYILKYLNFVCHPIKTPEESHPLLNNNTGLNNNNLNNNNLNNGLNNLNNTGLNNNNMNNNNLNNNGLNNNNLNGLNNLNNNTGLNNNNMNNNGLNNLNNNTGLNNNNLNGLNNNNMNNIPKYIVNSQYTGINPSSNYEDNLYDDIIR